MSFDVVSSWAGNVLLSLELHGHDAAGLLQEARRGVGASPKARLTWDELVLMLELAHKRYGAGRLERLMQEAAARHSSVRSATELLATPRMTFLVLLEGLALAQSMLSVSCRPTPAGIALRLELHRSLRPSRVLFECARWLLAAVPRARQLPDARLEGVKLSERELDCLIVPPTAPGLVLPYAEPSARQLAKALFRSPAVPLSPLREAPQVAMQSLQVRFGLTRAEARIVKLLCDGQSMKAIAADLDVSLETARTHAKRAMQKTDTHRQAELVSLVLNGGRRTAG